MARLLRFGLRLLFAGVLAWGCADTYAGIHVRVAAVENRSVIDVSKQGDADILRAVDRHLLHLKADPESLYYVHSRELEEAGRRRVQLPAWVTWAAGGAVVLLLLALGWAVSLRRASKRIAAVAALAADSEREQRRLNGEVRRIEENSLDLIAVFDAEFRVLRVSGAARELLARAPKDLVGRSCLEWLRPVDRQAGRDFLEQVRRGTPAHSAPSLVWRGDATTRRVLWSLVWSEQEQELYAIGRDDSERHELIKTLKRRREQLELANNDLQTFAQAVSHDLRSPVAAVVGFVDKVLRDEAGNLSERSQNLLARAHSAGQRMDRLIVNLLRFAQLSEAGMRRTDCDLSSLSTAIAGEIAGDQAAECFEVQVGMRAYADPDLVRHVLENLMSNAWKFSGGQHRARVCVGCVPGDEPVYFVRDNGAGFDMTHAGKLFTPFVRLHTEHEYAGTGIGLSIARRIVIGHGGRIWAESTPNAGSVFHFTLGHRGNKPASTACAPEELDVSADVARRAHPG